MAVRATLAGSFVLGSPAGLGSGPTDTLPIDEQAVYAYSESHSFAGTQTDAAVGLGPIASVKMLVGYADSPIQLKITHADGTDQVVPLDGIVALHCPSRPITALKLNGSASGRLMFAGD